MRNRNYRWASIMLIVLVAVGALGVTLYAFRGRLATAPFIGSVFGRAQVGASGRGRRRAASASLRQCGWCSAQAGRE